MSVPQIILLCSIEIILSYILLRRYIRYLLSRKNTQDELQLSLNEVLIELNRVTDESLRLLEEKIAELKDTNLRAQEEQVRLQKLIKQQHYERQQEHAYQAITDNIELSKVARDNNANSLDEAREASAEKPHSLDAIRKEVLKLSLNGFDNYIIARKLGLTLAEVELLINLAATN